MWIFKNCFSQCSCYTWILQGPIFHAQYGQWALLMASGFRLLSWNNHLLPFLMQEVFGFFFLIQGIWQVWAPSLWEHRWQLKGCWNDFTPTLAMTNWVSGESGKTLQICLSISCVSDKCGRGLMLPVMASAEVRGATCLPTLSWLILVSKSCPDFAVGLSASSASGHPVRSAELFFLSGN